MQNHLGRIRTFMAVAECGSFTRAAERLFVSKAMVSIDVKTLERALNAPLLIRGAKGVALTEAGQALYAEFSDIFQRVDRALERAAGRQQQLSGTLRLTSTAEFGEHFLLPLLGEFCAHHPQLQVSFYANSSLNDFMSEQLDLAVRLGTLRDSSLKSRRLASYDIKLVAAPAWLAANPLSRVEELAQVSWIANAHLASPVAWTLRHAQHPPVKIRARASYSANSASSVRAMARAGLGVALLPAWMIADDLAQRRLTLLFPDWTLPEQPVSILYPNGQALPRKSRAFIDFLLANRARLERRA